jgi:hypothetical protein
MLLFGRYLPARTAAALQALAPLADDDVLIVGSGSLTYKKSTGKTRFKNYYGTTCRLGNAVYLKSITYNLSRSEKPEI